MKPQLSGMAAGKFKHYQNTTVFELEFFALQLPPSPYLKAGFARVSKLPSCVKRTVPTRVWTPLYVSAYI